ncbi:MAG: hypothetical protein CL906_00100 [Dehalococcoidia bacterium]|nr:hypothetical protein [Chloroflexota bacterium]MBN32307.1 hypothetical protein [Dehalococcoidia bacterium]
MSLITKVLIFITISSMMISISRIFRKAEDGKINNENSISSSILYIFFVLILGLFIIMLSNF